MTTLAREKADGGEAYFSITSIGLGALWFISGALSSRHASPFRLWLIAGLVPAFCVIAAAASRKRIPAIVHRALSFVLVCLAGYVLLGGARLYVLPFVLAQTILVERALRRYAGDVPITSRFARALLAAAFTWACTIALVWTPLNEWLMSGSAATGLSAIVFCIAFVMLLGQTLEPLEIEHASPSRLRRIGEALVAGFIFFELAFRTDHLTFDWVPYHRSYWVGPAELLRAGHWLLWDVPTQYGFLSELAVAFAPGRNGWQSLYLLTGIVLSLQAMLLYALLRGRSGGWARWLCSVAVSSAVLFGSEATRFPFGARLYPQQGLRFLWPMLALFVLALRYLYREKPEVARRWFLSGWIVWAAGLSWSFETGVWTTLIWGGYLAVEQLVKLYEDVSLKAMLGSCAITRVLPCVVIPLALIGMIDGYYLARLGTLPDWTSFLEFSGLYANADVHSPPLKPLGPGLIVPLLLAGIATYGVVFARRRRFAALPLIAAAFAAVWGTSVYYVGEPFDQHINALFEVFVLAFAVLGLIEREERVKSVSLLFARLAIVPSLVLLVATAFGEPGRIATISAPFMPGFSFDGTREFPEVRGELAELMRRAGIKPDDPVNFPNRPSWVKLDEGIIMPFTREANGSLHEYPAWLPMSSAGPWNTLYSLPLDRRREYIERFLALNGHRGGWLIMYHEQADCTEISPMLRNVRTFAGVNFSATLCDAVSFRR